MADRGVYSALEVFRKGPDPVTTFDRFEKYVKRADLVFATAATTIDNDKKKLSFLQKRVGRTCHTVGTIR